MTTTKKKLSKEERANYMFVGKTGEELIKKPGAVNGFDFAIRDLNDCKVALLDTTAQIFIDNCKNTTFIVGPVKGSIFFRDCTDCTLSVACQQFRCRDLKNCTIFLYVANDPIIESSTDLKFGPFNVAYPFLDQQVQSAGFDINVNKWDLIFDFTKDESGKLNYSFVDPKDFQIISRPVEGIEQKPVLVFPYPQRYGGTLSDDANQHLEKKEDNMMAFGFDVNQNQAQKIAEQVIEQQEVQQNNNPYEQQADDDFDLFAAAGNNNYEQQQQQNFSQQDFLGGSQMQWQSQGSQPLNMSGNNFGDFSIPMNNSQSFPSQPVGFNPVFGQQQNFNLQFDGLDDLDDEERERILQVEINQQQMKQQLYFKEQEEQRLKEQRRQKGRQEVLNWQADRKKQIDNTRSVNKQMEEDYHSEKKRLKETTNPWERVMSNVEINSSQYVGSWDVTRMRQAMIARKNDITKSGGVKKQANML